MSCRTPSAADLAGTSRRGIGAPPALPLARLSGGDNVAQLSRGYNCSKLEQEPLAAPLGSSGAMSDLAGKLSNAVHLCVDMQRLFAPEGPWPTPWMEIVLPQAVRLTEHCPE